MTDTVILLLTEQDRALTPSHCGLWVKPNKRMNERINEWKTCRKLHAKMCMFAAQGEFKWQQQQKQMHVHTPTHTRSPSVVNDTDHVFLLTTAFLPGQRFHVFLLRNLGELSKIKKSPGRIWRGRPSVVNDTDPVCLLDWALKANYLSICCQQHSYMGRPLMSFHCRTWVDFFFYLFTWADFLQLSFCGQWHRSCLSVLTTAFLPEPELWGLSTVVPGWTLIFFFFFFFYLGIFDAVVLLWSMTQIMSFCADNSIPTWAEISGPSITEPGRTLKTKQFLFYLGKFDGVVLQWLMT